MSDISLTDEQEQAVELAVSNVLDGVPMTKIGGYAGTGKTTIIHEIRARILEAKRSIHRPSRGKAIWSASHGIPRVPVVAYTGKAACVLRSKGVGGASTIHSLIYKPHTEMVQDPRYTKQVKLIPKVMFGLVSTLDEFDDDTFYETVAIVIDEASMVGADILNDLMSFRVPIVAVGDPGQLPPVSKYDANLMENCDFILEKIHRQASNSGIIRFANDVRLTGPDYAMKQARVSRLEDVQIAARAEVWTQTPDLFIVGFNKSRMELNEKERARLGFDPKISFAPGERVVCLANNPSLGVFNGHMGTVHEIVNDEPMKVSPRFSPPFEIRLITARVVWDGSDGWVETALSTYALNRPKPDSDSMFAHRDLGIAVVDYGYAITCHKAQGSEWDRVAVFNESQPYLWSQPRWLYTAATRAAKVLSVGI